MIQVTSGRNKLLPFVRNAKANAVICNDCNYVNNSEYKFCTNCGYHLQNQLQADAYHKLREKTGALHKAVNALFVARSMLYVMALGLLLCLLVLFIPFQIKYIIALASLILSALFFFLASWCKKEPLAAMFTAFIIMVTFSAINIFNKRDVVFTTLQGFVSLLLCLALLFIIMKGLQGAYRLKLFTGINIHERRKNS